MFLQPHKKSNHQHDPQILVPVLNINPDMKNIEQFNKAFCSTIKDDGYNSPLTINMSVDDEDVPNDIGGVAPRSINHNNHLSKHTEATELIK